MTTPAGWTSLGCSSARCCCCPNTVYYSGGVSVTYSNVVFTHDADTGAITGSFNSVAHFDLSCVWLDCPRGTTFEGDTNCQPPDFGPPPAGPCWDGETCFAFVPRCHACVYALIGPRNVPGFEVDPGTGLMEAGTPSLTFNNPEWAPGNGEPETITVYISDFVIFCDCDTGVNGNHPAILTYVEPDTGVGCSWRGTYTLVKDNGAIFVSTVLNTYFDIPTGEYPDPVDFFNPLDPFKFSCCDPFHLRFLIGVFEPISWCGFYNNSSGWPDPSEWPPHPGELFPWNFVVPFCNIDPSGTCADPFVHADCTCDTVPVSDPPGWGGAPGCQANPYPGQPFGFVEINGDASCFLPRTYITNCLDAFKPDGC